MGRKRHTAEQIIAKLREAEIDTAYRCIDTLDGALFPIKDVVGADINAE